MPSKVNNKIVIKSINKQINKSLSRDSCDMHLLDGYESHIIIIKSHSHFKTYIYIIYKEPFKYHVSSFFAIIDPPCPTSSKISKSKITNLLKIFN